jgi:hypothetical protein
VTTPARQRVIEFWDEVVRDLLAHPDRSHTGSFRSAPLAEWRLAYDGRGRGLVDESAIPEPYLGPLSGTPKMVVLALNPGRADLGFQSATGVFAAEITALGSYGAWAASWPYLRDPWVAAKGRNRHHTTRIEFMRRWHDSPDLGADAMVAFELFPWHSHGVTAAMRPRPKIVREFIWEPISEFEDAPVFAFGAPWFPLLEHQLGLRVVARLGAGGRDYGSTVKSRAVLVLETPTGGLVIAEKHLGSATPPGRDEVERLREALAPFGSAA